MTETNSPLGEAQALMSTDLQQAPGAPAPTDAVGLLSSVHQGVLEYFKQWLRKNVTVGKVTAALFSVVCTAVGVKNYDDLFHWGRELMFEPVTLQAVVELKSYTPGIQNTSELKIRLWNSSYGPATVTDVVPTVTQDGRKVPHLKEHLVWSEPTGFPATAFQLPSEGSEESAATFTAKPILDGIFFEEGSTCRFFIDVKLTEGSRRIPATGDCDCAKECPAAN